MFTVKKTTPMSVEEADRLLSSCPQQAISTLNWPEAFPYAPKVSFAMVHDGHSIYLRFNVEEKSSAAMEMQNGNDVYMDSCVEFFLMPGDDDLYYNFEFNCAGTLCYSCRPGRNDAVKATPECHGMVKRMTSLPHEVLGETALGKPWSLTAVIPVEAFFKHDIHGALSGRTMRMNLYKCGDGLSTPHYVTWQPIAAAKPDYHRPECFVPVMFE